MKDLIKKWWFWLICLAITVAIGFTIIMIIGFNIARGGIHKVALAIQMIDTEATVYSSAGNNTIIIELSKPGIENVKQVEEEIKEFSEPGDVLENYSKLIIYIPSDTYLAKNVYKLPSMEQDISQDKIYIDMLKSESKNKKVNK